MTHWVFLRPAAIFFFVRWKFLFQTRGDTFDGNQDEEKKYSNYGQEYFDSSHGRILTWAARRLRAATGQFGRK